MKLKVGQGALAAALAVVARAVSSKQTIPVLAGVRLQADSESLVMRTTDLSLQIEHRIPADVEQAGATVLPARYLTELVKRLPFGDLRLDVAENEVTTIRAGKSKYNIHGFPANEFPEPAADEGVGITIGQGVLRDVIRKTAFAVCEDQSRPYLMGVHLQISGGKLLALSTDSVRIAHANVGMSGEVPDIDVIVPARSLFEISRLLADNESEVHIRVNDRAFLVDVGETKVAARLLEGRYPDVMRLLPQKYAGTVRFSKQPFVEACSRAAVIGRNGAVKLAISQDQISLAWVSSRLCSLGADVVEGEGLNVAVRGLAKARHAIEVARGSGFHVSHVDWDRDKDDVFFTVTPFPQHYSARRGAILLVGRWRLRPVGDQTEEVDPHGRKAVKG